MNWKTVRLELAGTAAFPSGSVSRGYLIRVPLNDNGSIDEEILTQIPRRATFRRFWSIEPDESGSVEFVDGDFALRCNGNRLLFIRPPSFKLGDQVAVIGSDGTSLPFRVASIHTLGTVGQRL